MEIGEEELLRSQQVVLGGDRFLDLDDHLRAGEDLGRGVDQLGAGRCVLGVGEAAAEPGVPLDEDLVPARDVLGDAGRGGRDAVLPSP